MILALYFFVDDDFENPIYGDPDKEDLEPELHTAVCETANDAWEGDKPPIGSHTGVDEVLIGWRLHQRTGLCIVCAVTDDVTPQDLENYLKALQKQYLDEVDDPREPEKEGVRDVVVEVIPPWEE